MKRLLSIALTMPMLLAVACDPDLELEDEPTAVVEPAPGQQPDEPDEHASAVDPELESLTCSTRDGEPGPTPVRSQGLTEPRYRIDESEGMSPESLTAPAPTEDELEAARRYSARFVADDGTLRTFSAAK